MSPLASSFEPILTRVAGVTFDNRDGTPRQPFIRRVRKDDRLTLVREPENPYDANAIAVAWHDAAGDVHQVGYVPRALAGVLAPLMDDGVPLTALAVRAQKVPRHGVFARPIWALRMAVHGDFRSLPARHVSGLEPAVEAAVLADEADWEASLAPALGGGHAQPELPAAPVRARRRVKTSGGP